MLTLILTLLLGAVAAWAAPEAGGPFREIPLEQEVDDTFWFVQSRYQDITEQVKPARKQRKGLLTSLEIAPGLMRTNLAGMRRKEEALKRLGRLKPGERLSIGGEARAYFPPYVARVTVGGTSRYRWFAEDELHGRYRLGSGLFHGLTPGGHKVDYEIWGDRGEYFKGGLTVLVDEKALKPKQVANRRKAVENARKNVERRPSAASLERQANALHGLAGALLAWDGAKPSAIYPLVEEASRQVERIPSMPQPRGWKSKWQTWKEYKDQLVRVLLLEEVKLLRRLGDQQALERLAELPGRIQEAGGYAHEAYLAQAEITFALTANVAQTRALLEKYVAERDRSVAKARAEGQIFGTVFVNRKPDWPRALKGLEKPVEEERDDGYWDWYAGYVTEKERRQQRIDEIRFELSVLAKQVRDRRARYLDLMRLDMELFEAGDVLESKVAGRQLGASAKQERDRLARSIHTTKYEQRERMDEGLEQIRLLKTSVENQKEKSGARRKDLTLELQYLEDQELMLELQFYDAAEWYALHELPRLIRDLKSKGSFEPEVLKMIEAKAHLADARNLEEQRNRPSATPRDPRLDEPLIKGAITARFKALQNAREVLAMNPHNTEARAMLQQMELYWLGQIGAKLEREKQASLAAFGAYLENRGYDKNDRSGWWEGFKEYAWVTWSSGPISLGAGLPGVDMPWVVAEDVSITQTEIAKNLVALLAIKRLRKNGVPLAEIREITPEELTQKMVLHTASRQELPEDKARRMVRDIRETFVELGELQALTDGRLVEFNLAMGRSHYGSMDAEQSWGEYLGDAFSPRHLISLFGPSAIVKVGGKWAFFGRMASSEIRAAEAAGQVMRGRNALVAGLRLEKLGESLAATRGGGALREKLLADHQWLTQLPGWEQVLRKGSAVVGTMIILGGASHLAAESGIPGAALLVDILSELTGQEILFDIMSKSGTPARKLLGRVDEFIELASKKQDDLARLGRTLDELDDIAVKARGRSGKVTGKAKKRLDGICTAALYDSRPHGEKQRSIRFEVESTVGSDRNPAARVLVSVRPSLSFGLNNRTRGIQRSPVAMLRLASLSGTPKQIICGGLGKAAGRMIPGNAEEATALLTKKAIDALHKGDPDEVRRLIASARKLNREVEARVVDALEKARAARGALGEMARKGVASTSTPALKKVSEVRPAPFARGDLYKGPAGRELYEADELLRQGKFGEALKRYKKARDLETTNGAMSDLLEERIALVLNAEHARKLIGIAGRKGLRIAAKKVISTQEAAEVLRRVKAGPGHYEQLGLSKNPVFKVKVGKNTYILKMLTDPVEATTEELAPILAGRVGIHAPYARRVNLTGDAVLDVVYDHKDFATGKIKRTQGKLELGLLSRHIAEGPRGAATKLADAPEAVAVALKEEYARQRVFRAWLGDADGHLGNQMYGADGLLWQIDFGMANLSSGNWVKQLSDALPFPNEAAFLEAVVGFSHGSKALPKVAEEHELVLKVAQKYLALNVENAHSYGWMARMDQMTRYDDMRETIDAIVNLTRNEADWLRRLLEKAKYPDPDDAVKALKARAEKLHEVFERRFGQPLEVGFWRPPSNFAEQMEPVAA